MPGKGLRTVLVRPVALPCSRVAARLAFCSRAPAGRWQMRQSGLNKPDLRPAAGTLFVGGVRFTITDLDEVGY